MDLSVLNSCCSKVLQSGGIGQFVLSVTRHSTTHETAIGAIRELLGTPEPPSDAGRWILHDTRKAPVIDLPVKLQKRLSRRGAREILVSLTDENEFAAALVVMAVHDSSLSGIGIDLASISDFLPDTHSERFYRYVFTSYELNHIQGFCERDRSRAAAALFSSKEAAIKSVSKLVRAFGERHPELFPTANFSEIEIRSKRGSSSCHFKGTTADWMRKLGVDEIRCSQSFFGQYAFAAASCMEH
jgi:phosphopantetheine--protein transferase-like protein